MRIPNFYTFLKVLLLVVFFSSYTNARIYAVDSRETEYLLPSDDPICKHLEKVFLSPQMFHSVISFKRAGFIVNSRVHEGLMVATHPQLKGYVFKKYQNNIPLKDQNEKYVHRINNAKLLQEYITEHNFQHIVVPKKWLYRLSDKFSKKGIKSYVLIAEDMDICSGGDNPKGENVQRYKNISKEALKELCQIMHEFGGCDAWPRNQPFTKSGKIAFVDTEHLGEKKRHFHKHIIPLLSKTCKDML